jgi:ABC-type uncharacterized transport system fused permease/ATPase subunit
LFTGKIKYTNLYTNPNSLKGSIFFLPQQNYMVLGSLREQIIYPDKSSKISENDLLRILASVNLSYIYDRFGRSWEIVKEWNNVIYFFYFFLIKI